MGGVGKMRKVEAEDGARTGPERKEATAEDIADAMEKYLGVPKPQSLSKKE